MHMCAEPVYMFQIPFQELVTALLCRCDTQHQSLLQENCEVHPTHRHILCGNVALCLSTLA